MTDTRPETNEETERDYLQGQFLIAMPGMHDPNFEKSVIYLCAHSEQGAVGLIINKVSDTLRFEELLHQLNIDKAEEVPPYPVYVGGPVETEAGFVLHSRDYMSETHTLEASETIGMTATLDILRAIARNEGPSKVLLAIGYAGWAPGQLEAEILANGWLHCPADEALIFDHATADKWERAVRLLGIDPSLLVQDAGHA